ncbi:hypothetical protein KKE19_00365 [Patescibacteria group bacterium]|nr:hypothetical protein [Patescibacteria group bacterium]MCG2700440.1 hypothetical protein [Candidatus Parcubacteria bacterium]
MRNFMLIEKATEKLKHPYDITRRVNNLVGFYSAVYGDAQFGRIESNPEQQECDKKSP